MPFDQSLYNVQFHGTLRPVLAVLLCSILRDGKGNDFNVRYNGGSLETKVSPDDWSCQMTYKSAERAQLSYAGFRVRENNREEATMALYKDESKLTYSDDAAFDVDHKPGDTTPHSGIYRCTACGKEIVSESGKPFPPQNHHQHTPPAAIRWRLLVYAVYQ